MAQAVYRINDFILFKVPSLLGYSGSGLRPIFPVQEVPESNSIPGPYLVYNCRTTGAGFGEEWWKNVDEVNYLINSTDMEQSAEIIEALDDAFRRMDESATELNAYLRVIGKTEFLFFYTRVMSKMSPEPVLQEGGRHSRLLTIRYEYAKTSGTGIS